MTFERGDSMGIYRGYQRKTTNRNIYKCDKMIQSENESYTLNRTHISTIIIYFPLLFTQLNPKKMHGLFINYTDAQLQNRI